VASVALLLGLTSLVGACSSNNNRQPETTGSVGQAQAQPRQAYNSNLPPVIHAPQTTSATPASYAPPPVYRTSYRNTAACNCPPRRRYDRRDYDRRDITASIPQTQSAYGANDRVNFIVHPIAPRDTLYSISRHYRTSMDDIAAVNRIRTDSQLQVGELLVVPTGLR
jgi:hypothetical protein